MMFLSWEVELRHGRSHQTNISKLKINFSEIFREEEREKREREREREREKLNKRSLR